MKFFDLQIDFFLPHWRRIALVAVCALATLFEFFNGSVFWGLVFASLGVMALWQFYFDNWPSSGNARSNNANPDNTKLNNSDSNHSNSDSGGSNNSGEE